MRLGRRRPLVDQQIGPADEASFPTTPASASKRHPPIKINGLPGAGGPVILGSEAQYQDIRRAVRTVGTALTNYESFSYMLAARSTYGFMNLELATPKAGLCALRLVLMTLQGTDGNQVHGIKLMSPGPALARYHAVLACGGFGSSGEWDVCAWASTDNAPRPIFGALWAFGPVLREHPLNEQQIVKLADLAFTAVDA